MRDDESLPVAEKEAQIAKLRAEWQVRHEAVIAAGGLHIVGTERHESRRIDNQLRGRAGRQGDPGSSRFYLSLEDPLLRIFGGERLGSIMQRLKMPEGEPIEHPIVNRSIAKAQNRVESRNFDIRKQLLEYDDVANDQRRVIYQQRDELLESTDIADTIRSMITGLIDETVKRYIPPESVEEQWDIPGLEAALASEFQVRAAVGEWLKSDPDITDADGARPPDRGGAGAIHEQGSPGRPRADAPVRAQPDAADASTSTGAITSPISTICARASTCAGTRRRIRSRNTSANRSSSSRTCSTGSSRTS